MIQLTQNSLLLQGTDGLPMLEDALDLAKRVLQVEHLDTHPDYLFIERKKSAGVEDALPVVEKGNLVPSLADHCVCIIDGIDSFNEVAQNKLLKTFEESNMQILAISYSDRVLSTIKSRLVPMSYTPLSVEEFMKQMGEGSEVLYLLTGGSIGLVKEYEDLVEMFQELYCCVKENRLEGLMPALHMVNEKDKLSIYKTAYMPLVVEFLENLFCQVLTSVVTEQDTNLFPYNGTYERDRAMELYAIASENKKVCKKPWYGKDNFFVFIMELIGGR